jgi:hypothetical protein
MLIIEIGTLKLAKVNSNYFFSAISRISGFHCAISCTICMDWSDIAERAQALLAKSLGFDTIIRSTKFRILPPQPRSRVSASLG